MKLAKNISIATAAIALAFAALSGKPAQAATVSFTGQAGNVYSYNVVPTSANETVSALSDIFLTNAAGITAVSAGTGFSNNVFTATGADFIVGNAVTAVNNAFTGLNFSVTSTFPQGPVTFGVLKTNPLSLTSGSVTGPSPVPEPMTAGGSLLAVGFGIWLKRKKAVSA